MKRYERVFCDDCPYPKGMCDTDENKCEMARWVKRTVDEAPPLTAKQIAEISAIFRSVKKK